MSRTIACLLILSFPSSACSETDCSYGSGTCRTPRRATSVLVASSANDGSLPQGVSRRTSFASPLSGGNNKANDLKGVIADVSLMYQFAHDRGIHVSKIFSDVDSTSVNRNTVLQKLQEVFRSGYDDVLLYYSGHGRQSDGAWLFEDAGGMHDFLTPDDVIMEWRKATSVDQKLIVVSDSCHSGWWVEAAYKEGSGRIVVQAASGISELSEDSISGGVFTRAWARGAHEAFSYWNALNPISYASIFVGGAQQSILRPVNYFASFTPTATVWSHMRNRYGDSWSVEVGQSELSIVRGWTEISVGTMAKYFMWF